MSHPFTTYYGASGEVKEWVHRKAVGKQITLEEYFNK